MSDKERQKEERSSDEIVEETMKEIMESIADSEDEETPKASESEETAESKEEEESEEETESEIFFLNDDTSFDKEVKTMGKSMEKETWQNHYRRHLRSNRSYLFGNFPSFYQPFLHLKQRSMMSVFQERL